MNHPGVSRQRIMEYVRSKEVFEYIRKLAKKMVALQKKDFDEVVRMWRSWGEPYSLTHKERIVLAYFLGPRLVKRLNEAGSVIISWEVRGCFSQDWEYWTYES